MSNSRFSLAQVLPQVVRRINPFYVKKVLFSATRCADSLERNTPSWVLFVTVSLYRAWHIFWSITSYLSVARGNFRKGEITLMYSTGNYILLTLTEIGTPLRHCVTSWDVVGSTPNAVIGTFHWHIIYGRIMAFGLTEPPKEMINRNISWR